MKRSEKIKLMQDQIDAESKLDPEEEIEEQVETKTEAVTEDTKPLASQEDKVDYRQVKVLQDGWFSSGGVVDYDKIKDENVRIAVETVEKYYKDKEYSNSLHNMIMDSLDNYDLDIDKDKAIKLLDKESISIKDGKLVGFDEQMKQLQIDLPMIFKYRRKSSKPTDQGMNPSGKSVTKKLKDIKF